MSSNLTSDQATQAMEPRPLVAERDYLETLSNERFNFLLVFYSLVIAGAFQTDNELAFAGILTVGAVICSMLAMPIARAQLKLDLILHEMESRADKVNADPAIRDDPAMLTRKWAKDDDLLAEMGVPRGLIGWFARKSRRRMIGYTIPMVCYVTLWGAAIIGWIVAIKSL